ncbi:hypothetical protein YPC_4322 [Yersinia pestis biovar Medievalis str. Harbin 35]|nr:hypothetical protein YPC_4322 [Yersinia pestis biovar Medievalis str. Harbin 35]EEO91787.1 hypothetical protein YPS_0732 [Yersinia pestis Pestoides A]
MTRTLNIKDLKNEFASGDGDFWPLFSTDIS